MASKIDFKDKLKAYYKPKTAPEIVDIPGFNFMMIDGYGSPESADFKTAIEILFSVSYKTKFLIKRHQGIDYGVMPLEGLWWADDMNDFLKGRREQWRWTLMIMQPDCVDQESHHTALEEVKKKNDPSYFKEIRFEIFKEGLCAQVMHIGPFADEHKNIIRLHNLIIKTNGSFDGKVQKHHEIYLSDFRRVDPKRMKTILRQPFSNIAAL